LATGEEVVSADDASTAEANRILIHDFRNLLSVIVNYCELIADETGDPDAVRADLKEIRTAAERALVLTEKLRRPPEGKSSAEAPAGTS
jgi:signal transduction histidine kinase